MSLDQFIALAASVGTCIAAVLAFLSLRETSRQRKEAYRPQLALKRQQVFASGIDGIATWTKAELAPDSIIDGYMRFGARLFNIGLGPAKEISIKWAFDVEALAREINRLAALRDGHVGVPRITKRTVEIRPRNKGAATFFLGSDLSQTFDFAVPNSTEEKGEEVNVPFVFSAMISMFLHEQFSSDEKIREIPDTYLEATLNISYSDIGGQLYTQSFRARVNVGAVSDGTDAGAKFFAMLDFASV